MENETLSCIVDFFEKCKALSCTTDEAAQWGRVNWQSLDTECAHVATSLPMHTRIGVLLDKISAVPVILAAHRNECHCFLLEASVELQDLLEICRREHLACVVTSSAVQRLLPEASDITIIVYESPVIDAAEALLWAVHHGRPSSLDCGHRRRLHVASEGPSVTYNAPPLLHELFLRAVQAYPDHIAIKEDATTVTYAQLLHLARQCQRHLHSDHDRRNRDVPFVVALWLPRSVDFIVAALGVLLTGGTYLPIDVSMPAQRAHAILTKAQCFHVITDAAHVEAMEEEVPHWTRGVVMWDARDVCRDVEKVDDGGVDMGKIDGGECGAEDGECGGGDASRLAYIIFTSGSTGQPKGVAISHRSIVHLIAWVNHTYHVSSADRLLFTASIGFDLSCYDVFGSLAAGATIVIAPEKSSPEATFALMRSEHITFWDSAPAVLFQIKPLLDGTNHTPTATNVLPSLRLIFLSGDWIPIPLAQSLLKSTTAQLIALGGATEVTVWSNHFPVRHIDANWTSVPYGTAIANHWYVVLGHDEKELVGIDTPGPLYIGGIGVAKEYYRDEQLTDERFPFLPYPYDGTTRRMYMTGDLCRWRVLKPWGSVEKDPGPSNLVLEFLGRADFQVKVRGYRVETGEIERRCEEFPSIDAAVVLAFRTGDAAHSLVDNELVAFVSPHTVCTSRLRAFLQKCLPHYMVPDAIVALQHMPVSINGKVDRAALKKLDYHRMAQRNGYVAPTSAEERHVVQQFADVLEIDVRSVGVHDDFFTLGGHSIRAMVLQKRLQIRLQDIFDLRTPAEIATKVVIRAAGPVECQYRVQGMAPRGALSPASYAQERLWAIDALERQNTYNIPFAYRLAGPEFDPDRLVKALEALLERHEALRTTLHDDIEGGSGLLQRVEAVPKIDIVDLHQFSQAEADERLVRLAHSDAHLPFNLAEESIRIKLFLIPQPDDSSPSRKPKADLRFAPKDAGIPRKLSLPSNIRYPGYVARAILYVNVHHSSFDALSVPIFQDELWALYKGDALEPLPLQYKDFSRWQQQWLENGELAHQMEYWKDYLQGVQTTLDFPNQVKGQRGPAKLHSSGEALQISLSSTLADDVQRLASACKTTTFVLLLATYGVFLGRHCATDELLIGIPIAGRQHLPGLDKLIGFFVNTLPIRVKLKGTFRQVVDAVHTSVVSALSTQDVPWQKLKLLLGDAQDVVLHTMFDFHHDYDGFNFCATNNLDEVATGVHVEPWVVRKSCTILEAGCPGAGKQGVKFDISLDVFNSTFNNEEGFTCSWEYSTDIFDEASVRLLAHRFVVLLENVCSSPFTDVAELQMLPTTEHRSALHVLPFSPSPPLPPITTPHLIFAAAARTPHNIAIRNTGRPIGSTMTYHELATHCNRLHVTLSLESLPPRSAIGLYFAHCVEFYIAVLSVLRAGHCFVPLPVTAPNDRLQFMCDDASVVLILHQPAHAPQVARPARAIPVVVDTREVSVSAHHGSHKRDEDDGVEVAARPHDGMYILYTSGTTGKPKGVPVSHRAFLTHALACCRKFALTPDDCILQSIPLAFDFAFSQIFPPLCMGASICVPTQFANPKMLIEDIRTHHVTAVDFVPSFFALFAMEDDEEVANNRTKFPFSQVRRINLGGEALPPALRTTLEAHMGVQKGSLRVFNTYGPTEAAVDTTTWELTSAEPRTFIGRPDSWRVVHLNGAQMVNLPGTLGELIVAGPGVGIGYLNGVRFSDHAYGVGAAYATGDLARWATTQHGGGNLEFCGRKDLQIKLRGQRIEVEEIENVLASMAQAACVKLITPYGLIAFVVIGDTTTTPTAEGTLLDHCRATLPEYMVPSAIVVLSDDFPRGTSGKIDRHALTYTPPCPDSSAQTDTVRPYTNEEHDLAAAVMQVLKIHEVDLRLTFPRLGGDSIAAIRVAARMSERYVCTASTLLRWNQSLCALAATLRRRVVPSSDDALADDDNAMEGSFPLTPIMQRFFHLRLRVPNHYNQSYILRAACGGLDAGALQRAFTAVCARHAMLRARFAAHAPYAALSPSTDIPCVDRVDNVETEGDFHAVIKKTQGSLDLVDGPVTAMAWMRGGADAFRSDDHIVWVVHHLCVDIVSWQSLLSDFDRAYAGSTSFPPKSLPFRAYAQHLQRRPLLRVSEPPAAGTEDAAPVTEPRAGTALIAECYTIDCTMDNAVLSNLLQQDFLTMEDMLLCALSEPLHELGVDTVDVENHGRDVEMDVIHTVGWFTALRPIALAHHLAPDARLQEIRHQVRVCPLNYSLQLQRRHAVASDDVTIMTDPLASVNFHGRQLTEVPTSAVFASATPGPHDRSPLNYAEYALEVEAWLTPSNDLVIEMTSFLPRASVHTCLNAAITHLRHLASSLPPSPTLLPLPVNLQCSEFLSCAALRQLMHDGVIDGANIERICRVSALQEGILLAYLTDRGSYVEQQAWQLPANFDVHRWREAWLVVHAEVEAMRTTFVEHSDSFLMIVYKQQALQWTTVPSSSPSCLSQFLATDRAQGFALGGPLIRFTLLFPSEEHEREGPIFVQTEHHSLIDGWSSPLLFDRAVQRYRKMHTPQHSDGMTDLPPLVPFSEFCATQARERDLDADRAFWRAHMRPLAAVRTHEHHTPLHVSSNDDELYGFFERTLPWDIEPQILQRHNVTFAAYVHAAWLLCCATAWKQDGGVPLCGTAVSNRHAAGAERVIGMLIATLPLCVPVINEEGQWHCVNEYVGKVQESLGEVQEHALMPVSEIWHLLHRTEGSAADLLKSIVVVENYPRADHYPKLPTQSTGAIIPLAIIFHDKTLIWRARRGTFPDVRAMERLLHTYVCLLDSLHRVMDSGISCEHITMVGERIVLQARGDAHTLPLVSSAFASIALPRTASATALASALCSVCTKLSGQPVDVCLRDDPHTTRLLLAPNMRSATHDADTIPAQKEVIETPSVVRAIDSLPCVGQVWVMQTSDAAREKGAGIWVHVCSAGGDATLYTTLGPQIAHLLASCVRAALKDANVLVEDPSVLLECCQGDQMPTRRDPTTMLHHLFIRAAKHHRDAIAVCDNNFDVIERTTTYLGLLTLARRVQRRLAPYSIVALWLPRGRDFIAVAAGVLLAKGTYVPIDEKMPWERVEYIVETAQCKTLVVTHASKAVGGASGLGGGLIVHVVDALLSENTADCDDADGNQDMEDEDDHDVDRPAYIIFTSGSTGKPKGVVISHQSIVHLIRWVNETYQVSSSDRLLFTTSIGFDLSCYDVFGILAAGACIVVAPENSSPDALLAYLKTHAITFWDSAPAVLFQLNDIITCDLPRLRLVFLSGDWVPLPLIRTLRTYCPTTHLVALGGATEVTVWSNFFDINDAAKKDSIDPLWKSIPYGRPIWNHRYMALHNAGRTLLPIGVTGELYISGIGVAKEYVSRPDLTAERFVKVNHYGAVTERMYKTGDLVRWMAREPWGDLTKADLKNKNSFCMEFLGRADFQVKVRGYRVELGEIEARCSVFGGVEAAVVIARRSGDAENGLVDNMLVAFVTPRELVVDELKTFLQKTLPKYMVPEIVIALSEFPLSVNGKVDRAALLDIDPTTAFRDIHASTASHAANVLPTTALHHTLCGLFRSTLGFHAGAKLFITDDFFTLGGHSLRAVHLHRALRVLEPFATVPLHAIFTHRTVHALCAWADGGATTTSPLTASTTATDSNVDVESAQHHRHHGQDKPLAIFEERMERENKEECAASLAQERLWVVHQMGDYAYAIPIAYRVRHETHVVVKAIHALVERHPVLRTVYYLAEDSTVMQRILDVSMSPSVHSITHTDDAVAQHAAIRWLHADAATPFDLENCCPVRAAAHGSPSGWTYVCINVHHIAFDGISEEIFERELATILDNKPLPPPISHAYTDYARWHRLLVSIHNTRLRTYWRTQLADVPRSTMLAPGAGGLARGQLSDQHVTSDPIHASPRGDHRACKSEDSPQIGHESPHDVPAQSARCAVRARVQTLAAEFKVSETSVLCAAFMLALALHSGRHTLMVGMPFAGRSRPEVEHMIGFFVNSIPIRLALTAGAGARPSSFSHVCRSVHASIVDAMEYEALPWQLIHEDTKLDLECFFQFHPEAPQQFLDPFHAALACTTASKFPLTCDIFHDYTWQIAYRGTDASCGFSEFFARLVPALLRYPSREVLHWAPRVRHLPSPPIPDVSVAQLIWQQVRRTPHATAIILDDDSCSASLSYMHFYHHARSVAFPPCDTSRAQLVVGILCPPGIPLCVALFASLLRGHAFAPLDPNLPLARLIACSKNVDCIVTISALAPLAQELHFSATNVIVLAPDAREKQRVQHAEREVDGFPTTRCGGALAAVYHTSGSTGEPKPIGVPQKALLSHLLPYVSRFMDCQDVVLQTTNFTFDQASSQFFGAWVCGATLRIVPKFYEKLHDPHVLTNATYLCSVPSLLALLPTPIRSAAPFLRTIGSGGEDLPAALLHHLAPIPVHNRYGPTECGINTTWGGPHDDDNVEDLMGDAHKRVIPIGIACPHRSVRCVWGEITVAGPGVAQYMKVTNTSGFRDYKYGVGTEYVTGDCGRVETRRGVLIFSGRTDDQIKIHGVRMELGEIEAAIRGPCVYRPPHTLVGFVDNLQHARTACATFLRVTIQFIQCATSELPRLPSGKVDRAALWQLYEARPVVRDVTPAGTANSDVHGPEATHGALLASILSDVLGGRVAVTDKVLDLGLTSLAAIATQHRLRVHGVWVDIASLLTADLAVGEHVLLATNAAGQYNDGTALLDHLVASFEHRGAECLAAAQDAEKDDPCWWLCPGDGGFGVGGYKALAAKLGHLWALDCRHTDEFATFTELADQCMEQIRAVTAGCARAFVGHSWGCLLALVLAHRLQRPCILIDPDEDMWTDSWAVSDDSVQSFLGALSALTKTPLPLPENPAVLGALERAAKTRCVNLSMPSPVAPQEKRMEPIYIILAGSGFSASARAVREAKLRERIGLWTESVVVSWIESDHWGIIHTNELGQRLRALVPTKTV